MRTRLALLSLLLSSTAFGQTLPSPAQMGITPASPQTLNVLDSTKTWVPIGNVDPSLHSFTAWLKQNLDPRTYGAKCDGTTDDTTALQAMAAAVVADSAVYVPGVCAFKSTIAFPAVNRVMVDGPGTLLYTGTSTTNDGVVIGQAVANCAVTGWSIKRLRVLSNTVMTAGDGVHLLSTCDMNIRNLVAGGNLSGNQNWWNALHVDGGNSIYVNGYTLSASNNGLLLNGLSTNSLSDPFFNNGIVVRSLVGVHVAGRVGGLTMDNSDVLLNGTNVLIDQSAVPGKRNGVLFFGEHFFSDATSSLGTPAYPGSPQIGVHVSDPDTIIVYKGWAASASAQCFAIDNMAAPATDGGYISFDGAQLGNCHSTSATMGAALDNQNQYFKITVNGGRFFNSQSSFPTVYNNPSAPPIQIQGATYDAGFNLAASPNNITWQRVSSTSGAWALNAAQSVYVRAASGTFVGIGPGATASDCGLQIQNGSTVPWKMDNSATCAVALGTVAAPFNSIDATTYKSGSSTGFTGTKTAGACVLTITGGIITNVTGC